MNFLVKWEQRFGRWAIPNLTKFIILTYGAGYILALIGAFSGNSSGISSLLVLSPSLILKGQIWRLFSWLLIPPGTLTLSAFDFLTLIMLVTYYQLGTALERAWGDFMYNVYIFSGLIMTVVGAFLLYAFTGVDYGGLFSTFYVSLSIFLGFAMTYPEQRMLVMFIIPIKIKFIAFIDIFYLVYSIVQAAQYGLWLPVLVMILCSLTGTILFFFGTKGYELLRNRPRQRVFKKKANDGKTIYIRLQRGNPGAQNNAPPPADQKTAGQRETSGGPKIDRRIFSPQRDGSIHRCAVCGRTELTDPNLEFRFCSKCAGNYEYCTEHLHDHVHIQMQGPQN
ncbi:MAG: hypothetical protein HUJ73_02705 [Eubacterium sp.]|nr:hypothetical protein [Eubacterium sp.]